jgi:hypothetical protein
MLITRPSINRSKYSRTPTQILANSRNDIQSAPEHNCRGNKPALTKGHIGMTYNMRGGAKLPNPTLIDALCAAIDQAFYAD